MPRNGEKNTRLGFYKNLCCGKEIVVPAGNEFPDCPNHRGLTTIWKPHSDDIVVQLGKTKTREGYAPIFQVGDQVIFVGVGKQRGKPGGVVEVIEGTLDQVHRYQVRLNDGTWVRCFGFELQLLENESSKSA
jgi:hypothetical protein